MNNVTESDRRKVTNFEEYWNAFFDEKPILVDIMQSEYSDKDDEMLVTTVGRGIAICLNNDLGAAALTHIISNQKQSAELQLQISETLDELIDQLTNSNLERTAIKAKLFGAAKLDKNDKEDSIQLLHNEICSYLKQKEISLTMQDIGNDVVRRIHFFPKSGKVVRRVLNREIDRSNQVSREQEWEKAQ